jgi:hypothetical protein
MMYSSICQVLTEGHAQHIVLFTLAEQFHEVALKRTQCILDEYRATG